MSGPPIDEQDYIAGVKVVDIGDLRVARGKSRRHRSSCRHRRLVYDQQERRVWCKDCESDVEAFDAFVGLIEQWYHAADRLNRRAEEVREAEAFTLRSRAAKAMDEAWRRRTMVPICPSCNHPLMPEQAVRGFPQMSRELAERMIEKGKKK